MKLGDGEGGEQGETEVEGANQAHARPRWLVPLHFCLQPQKVGGSSEFPFGDAKCEKTTATTTSLRLVCLSSSHQRELPLSSSRQVKTDASVYTTYQPVGKTFYLQVEGEIGSLTIASCCVRLYLPETASLCFRDTITTLASERLAMLRFLVTKRRTLKSCCCCIRQ